MLQNGHKLSVAAQAISKPEDCLGAAFILRAGARVRVHVLAGFVMGAGFCKNHDEPINYTVRVMCRVF
jgi:intein/homing endonuclease